MAKPTKSSSAAEPTAASAGGEEWLGDFTMTPRVLPIAALAIVIGTVSAFFALGLLGW